MWHTSFQANDLPYCRRCGVQFSRDAVYLVIEIRRDSSSGVPSLVGGSSSRLAAGAVTSEAAERGWCDVIR